MKSCFHNCKTQLQLCAFTLYLWLWSELQSAKTHGRHERSHASLIEESLAKTDISALSVGCESYGFNTGNLKKQSGVSSIQNAFYRAKQTCVYFLGLSAVMVCSEHVFPGCLINRGTLACLWHSERVCRHDGYRDCRLCNCGLFMSFSGCLINTSSLKEKFVAKLAPQ